MGAGVVEVIRASREDALVASALGVLVVGADEVEAESGTPRSFSPMFGRSRGFGVQY